MKRVIFALLFLSVAVCAVGCATMPKPRLIDDTVSLSAPYDQVWEGVIETLAELNMPIDNMEKASGPVTIDWMSLVGTGNKEYCDCGGIGIASEKSREGKFNIFVKTDKASGGTTVKGNAMYRQVRSFLDASSAVDCVSTGILEAKLHEKVKEKL